MAAQRDEHGRFVKGEYQGGPGRPPRAVEESYLQTLQRVTSLDQWEAIVRKAIEQAKKGDNLARKWLGDYLMGAPKQGVEMSGPEGGPIEFASSDETTDEQRLALLVALYERVREGAVDSPADGQEPMDPTTGTSV
jgi:hypothetical protein